MKEKTHFPFASKTGPAFPFYRNIHVWWNLKPVCILEGGDCWREKRYAVVFGEG